jgi:hypothetical protein
MKNNAKILTLICLGVIIISMFLPFYEGPREKGFISEDSFLIVEIYDSPNFGLTIWVFNGFGSLFALTNLLMAIILVLSRFFFPKSLVTAILVSGVFIISLGSLIYGTSDGQGARLPDEMLSGFYLLLICQVILIAQAYTKAITEPAKDSRIDSDILDF